MNPLKSYLSLGMGQLFIYHKSQFHHATFLIKQVLVHKVLAFSVFAGLQLHCHGINILHLNAERVQSLFQGDQVAVFQGFVDYDYGLFESKKERERERYGEIEKRGGASDDICAFDPCLT